LKFVSNHKKQVLTILQDFIEYY